jgi:hypothetical protein
MKNFTKSLLVFAVALTAMFTVAMARPTKVGDPKPKVEMYFLRGSEFTSGSVMTAELAANTPTEVDLVIENEVGDSFGEKHVVIDNGAKLIKFKIADVPSGTYYVKVHHKGRVQMHPFIVK